MWGIGGQGVWALQNHVTQDFQASLAPMYSFWLISTSQQTLSAPFSHLISHHPLSAVMGHCSQYHYSNAHCQTVNKGWQNTVPVTHVCRTPRPRNTSACLRPSFLWGGTAKVTNIVTAGISDTWGPNAFFLILLAEVIVKRRAQGCLF